MLGQSSLTTPWNEGVHEQGPSEKGLHASSTNRISNMFSIYVYESAFTLSLYFMGLTDGEE